MSWNYRVIRRKWYLKDRAYINYSVHEVFYDDGGRISSWVGTPAESRDYDDLGHLYADLQMQSRAIDLPVLIECGACQRLYETEECPVHGQHRQSIGDLGPVAPDGRIESLGSLPGPGSDGN